MIFPAWHEDALCAEMDGDLFFPEAGGTTRETALAKAVCERCPVKKKCLEEALSNNETYGIWAGTTPVERQALRRLRKKVAQVSE